MAIDADDLIAAVLEAMGDYSAWDKTLGKELVRFLSRCSAVEKALAPIMEREPHRGMLMLDTEEVLALQDAWRTE